MDAKSMNVGPGPFLFGGRLQKLYIYHTNGGHAVFTANYVFFVKGCLHKWSTGVCHNCQALQHVYVNWLVESIVN